MSTLQVKSRLDRRPSFWKTPIPRNLPISGNKRNYSQINNSQQHISDQHQHTNEQTTRHQHTEQIFPIPNKKRRLLTDSEITRIAATGGFNPSNILIAVEENDGFCWFKTKQNNKDLIKEEYLSKYWNVSTIQTDKDRLPNTQQTDNVLRELSKDELKERKQQQIANPNSINKQKAKAMQKIAKMRRHTAPIHVLQALIAQNDKKEEELMQDSTQKSQQQQLVKKKKKRRRKKVKKVITYQTKKEIIRKKVKKKKRILKKKKYLHQNIKITTEFAAMSIPDFPIPNLKFCVLFACDLANPLVAIKNFELALIESFVLPLSTAYGQSDEWSFITRNALQFLMQIKQNIAEYVDCIAFETAIVPIKSSLIAYNKNEQHIVSKKNEQIRKEETPLPELQMEQDLCGEIVFYEQQLAQINSFCVQIEEEIEFTTHAQQQLANDDYLRQIFDFDMNEIEMSVDEMDTHSNVMNDDAFVNQIASEIDKIYTEYALDFRRIQFEQNKFECQLEQREIEQFALAKQTKSNVDTKQMKLESTMTMNECTKDRLILSNCIEANRDNDYREDTMTVSYLRQLDGYQMNEDDTMNMDVDV